MSYAIGALKADSNERVFLGKTSNNYFLWTKNKNLILQFDSLQGGKDFWNKLNPHLQEEMLTEVKKESIALGNIDFKSIVYLYEGDEMERALIAMGLKDVDEKGEER